MNFGQTQKTGNNELITLENERRTCTYRTRNVLRRYGQCSLSARDRSLASITQHLRKKMCKHKKLSFVYSEFLKVGRIAVQFKVGRWVRTASSEFLRPNLDCPPLLNRVILCKWQQCQNQCVRNECTLCTLKVETGTTSTYPGWESRVRTESEL